MQTISMNDIMVALRHEVSNKGIEHNGTSLSAKEALRLVEEGLRAGEKLHARRRSGKQQTIFRIGRKVQND